MAESTDKDSTGCCCVGFIIYWIVGAFLFDYSLWAYWNRDVPWYLDAVGGFFIGWVAIPAAFIAYFHGGPFPILK